MKIQVREANSSSSRTHYLTKTWRSEDDDTTVSYNTTELGQAYDFHTVAEVYEAMEGYHEQWKSTLEIVDRVAIDHMSRQEHAAEIRRIMGKLNTTSFKTGSGGHYG